MAAGAGSLLGHPNYFLAWFFRVDWGALRLNSDLEMSPV
jgi:hypothetical protein